MSDLCCNCNIELVFLELSLSGTAVKPMIRSYYEHVFQAGDGRQYIELMCCSWLDSDLIADSTKVSN